MSENWCDDVTVTFDWKKFMDDVDVVREGAELSVAEFARSVGLRRESAYNLFGHRKRPGLALVASLVEWSGLDFQSYLVVTDVPRGTPDQPRETLPFDLTRAP